MLGGDLGHVPVSKEHIAAGRIFEAGDHSQSGGLAAAGGPQQGYHLAVFNLKVDMVHSHKVLAAIWLLKNFGHVLQDHAGTLLAEVQLRFFMAHFDSSVFDFA